MTWGAFLVKCFAAVGVSACVLALVLIVIVLVAQAKGEQ